MDPFSKCWHEYYFKYVLFKYTCTTSWELQAVDPVFILLNVSMINFRYTGPTKMIMV